MKELIDSNTAIVHKKEIIYDFESKNIDKTYIKFIPLIFTFKNIEKKLRRNEKMHVDLKTICSLNLE